MEKPIAEEYGSSELFEVRRDGVQLIVRAFMRSFLARERVRLDNAIEIEMAWERVEEGDVEHIATVEPIIPSEAE